MQVLSQAYGRAAGAFVPVYGRRRVGKSALILKFLAGKPGLYFVGKQAPAGLQLREFLQVAARALEQPLLAEVAVNSWQRAFELVEESWKGEQKFILALDEFQWMATESPELASVLQELWDRRWQRSGRMFLILCGSYVGFMEREVLGGHSPLFGRRTGQIHLKPFGYREAREFHPRFSLPDAARTYFLCGGVPQYLQTFSQDRSLEQNVQEQVLTEFAPLFNEPDFLLREELREVHNYYALLTELATGSQPARELARRTGVPERSVAYYLTQMVELGYVRRRYPLTDKAPVARSVRFRLDDPLLRFWFRFVFPNRSLIARLGPAKAFTQLVRPDLTAYFGGCFEALCREALPVLYEREGVAADFEVGEYWDKATQLDVVGVRQDNWTDLGECKWGEVRSLRRLAGELAAKVPHYPNARNATIGRRLFVREGSQASPSEVMVHTLSDLYD